MPMHRLLTRCIAPVAIACLLTACGAEAVGSAATGAAVKQQELENAKRTQQQVQQDVQKALEIPPERAKQLDQ